MWFCVSVFDKSLLSLDSFWIFFFRILYSQKLITLLLSNELSNVNVFNNLTWNLIGIVKNFAVLANKWVFHGVGEESMMNEIGIWNKQKSFYLQLAVETAAFIESDEVLTKVVIRSIIVIVMIKTLWDGSEPYKCNYL